MRKAEYSENLMHIFLLFSILAIIIAAYDIILPNTFNSTEFIEKSAPLLQYELSCIDIEDEKSYLEELEKHDKLSSNVAEFKEYVSSQYIPNHLKKLSIKLITRLNDFNTLSKEQHTAQFTELTKKETYSNIKEESIVLDELRLTINNISNNIRDYLSSI